MFHLYLFLLLLSLGAGVWLGYGQNFWGAAAAFLASGFCGWSAAKVRGKGRAPGLLFSGRRLKGLEGPKAPVLEASFAKAVDDYNYLQSLRGEIKDTEMVQDLVSLQNISANMLRYMEHHPERTAQAEEFINIYQDKTVSMLRQYMELEETQLASSEVAAMKVRVKDMLRSFHAVYEEQFGRLLNYQLMDLDAELQVLQRSLQKDGRGGKNGAAPDDPAKDRVGIAAGNVPESFLRRQPAGGHSFFLERLAGLARGTSVIPQEMYWHVVRRKLTASLLGIFFGGFGAHKFFLGKNFQGIGYIVFLWTGIPIFVGFIEGVRWLFMPVDDFYFSYCDG